MLSREFLRQALLTIHFVGLVFGFGGATVGDFSFFRSLRKGDRVTAETVSWMRYFSKIVWAGIGILSVSGLGLFLMSPSKYLGSPGFLAKMVAVAVLIINGYFLNFYVTARLTTFNFSQKYARSDSAWKVRKLSMIFGAVSAVSWYSALFFAEFKDYYHVSFYVYILVYLLFLMLGIAALLGLEIILYRRGVTAVNQPKVPTIEQLSYRPSSTVARSSTPTSQPTIPDVSGSADLPIPTTGVQPDGERLKANNKL